MPTLQQLVSAKLASSGLDAADGKSLHMQGLTPEQCKVLLTRNGNTQPAAQALQIPYFDLKGKLTKFWRVRYLEDPRPNGFAHATMAKAPRYLQPAKTLPEVYLPPLVDWTAISVDATQNVVITEGELKSASTTKNGIPCIGLGGVFSYMSSSMGVPMLPMLEQFNWKNRETVIAYDSDSVTNPMVGIAQLRLAAALLQMGANVSIAMLPAKADGTKQGLDDFIVEHGAAELRRILNAAQIVSECKALQQLNEEVAFIKNSSLVLELSTGKLMQPKVFKEADYANRIHEQRTINAQGTMSFKRIATAPMWLTWPYRKTYARIVYSPGKPLEYGDVRNTWAGLQARPVKGDITQWNKMLKHLFKTDGPEARKWFEQWLAYPLQFPGAKLYSAVVMYSEKHGTGKSLMGESMQQIYGVNFKLIDEKNLHERFNSWAENKQFVVGEEISSGETRKSVIQEIVKNMITRQDIDIEKKFLTTYTIDDCINYMLLTNHIDAFIVEDHDRRLFMCNPKDLETTDFYNAYSAWVKSEKGRNALLSHLLSVDLKGFDPRSHAPMTPTKQHIKDTNNTDLGRWVKELIENPYPLLRVSIHGVHNPRLSLDLVSLDDLYEAFTKGDRNYRTTASMLAKELVRKGAPYACEGQQVETPDGRRPKMFILRNHDRWLKARPAEAKAYVNGKPAPQRAPKRKF